MKVALYAYCIENVWTLKFQLRGFLIRSLLSRGFPAALQLKALVRGWWRPGQVEIKRSLICLSSSFTYCAHLQDSHRAGKWPASFCFSAAELLWDRAAFVHNSAELCSHLACLLTLKWLFHANRLWKLKRKKWFVWAARLTSWTNTTTPSVCEMLFVKLVCFSW